MATPNSFHTRVVANILRDGLKPFLKGFRFPDPTMINLQFQAEVRECQQIYSPGNTRKTEKLDDWMERLEKDDPIPAMPLRVEFTSRSLIIHRMMELLTYRAQMCTLIRCSFTAQTDFHSARSPQGSGVGKL